MYPKQKKSFGHFPPSFDYNKPLTTGFDFKNTAHVSHLKHNIMNHPNSQNVTVSQHGSHHRIGWYCAATRFGGSFLRMKRTSAIGSTSVNCSKRKRKENYKNTWLSYTYFSPWMK